MNIRATCVCLLIAWLGQTIPLEAQTNDSAVTNSALVEAKPSVRPLIGLHLFAYNNQTLDELTSEMPKLAVAGVNALIVETSYNFAFKSHPEVGNPTAITRERARKLGTAARQYGVRLIPELNCLGHQSWRRSTHGLLKAHPEFQEPSPSNPDPQTDYLKSWCPQHPRVNSLMFDLIDELVEAFDADSFHAGMDEVFNIASDKCARCKDDHPAKLFAKAVNDLHRHIVIDKKWQMFIWGDRLLDSQKTGYSKWESSRNGTSGAIDLIPKDIIVCDWHYENRADYPSVPLLLEKGFRVWPAGFEPLEATMRFSEFTRQQRATNSNVVGYLCTTWSRGKPLTVLNWPPVREVLKTWAEPAGSTNKEDRQKN